MMPPVRGSITPGPKGWLNLECDSWHPLQTSSAVFLRRCFSSDWCGAWQIEHRPPSTFRGWTVFDCAMCSAMFV